MAISPADAPVFTDLAGLSALKRGAANKDPAAVREVARQFESMFTSMMFKSMREAGGSEDAYTRERLRDLYEFFNGLNDVYTDIRGLTGPVLRRLLKARGGIRKLVGK